MAANVLPATVAQTSWSIKQGRAYSTTLPAARCLIRNLRKAKENNTDRKPAKAFTHQR